MFENSISLTCVNTVLINTIFDVINNNMAHSTLYMCLYHLIENISKLVAQVSLIDHKKTLYRQETTKFLKKHYTGSPHSRQKNYPKFAQFSKRMKLNVCNTHSNCIFFQYTALKLFWSCSHPLFICKMVTIRYVTNVRLQAKFMLR